MRRSAAAVFALLVCACRDKKIRPQECAQMLDYYIDMIALVDPAAKNLPPAQAAAVRETKKALKKAEARYTHAQAQCEADVTVKEYRCAMAAKNPDEWEACIE
jgi:hypothetical protein